MRPLFRLCLLLFVGVAPARADRDIVYAARYYAPPGSHRISHFHLYRINPNGTGRTQLTSGDEDDTDPHWSPDGRRLLFLHGEGTVCVADADGGDLRRIADFGTHNTVASPRWLPDGRTVAFVHYGENAHRESISALWALDVLTRHAQRYHVTDYGVSRAGDYAASPDGKSFLVKSWTGDGIVNRRTGALVLLPRYLREGAWLGNDRLVGHDYEMPFTLCFYGHSNDDKVRVTIYPPEPYLQRQYATKGGGWLEPSPHPDSVVYALSEYNRTSDFAAYFRVTLHDGAMHFLTEGQFLAWAPDKSHFCTAPGCTTWTYKERKWDGIYKTVWAAPLQVGSEGGRLKTITRGLVWVTGADWRKRKP